MAGSIDMEGRAIEFKVKAGSRATVQLIVADSSGNAKDLTNTTTFATGKWKVWKPGGTLIIDGTISFTTRASAGFPKTNSCNAAPSEYVVDPADKLAIVSFAKSNGPPCRGTELWT